MSRLCPKLFRVSLQTSSFCPENEETSSPPPCGFLIRIYLFCENWSTETFRGKESTLRLPGLSLDLTRDGEPAEPKAAMGSGLTLSDTSLLHFQRGGLGLPNGSKKWAVWIRATARQDLAPSGSFTITASPFAQISPSADNVMATMTFRSEISFGLPFNSRTLPTGVGFK